MLKVNALKYSFGSNVIFENLDLEFEMGKTYGIVGANGVGKTTLFRVMNGLYKAKSGTIEFGNQVLKKSQIGFLPTDPFFYPYMKGYEYLEISITDPLLFEKAIKMSSVLNVPLNQLVDSYSTGMKKKLAFLACRAQNRPVNIYDEPFNGVDLESNEILRKILLQENSAQITMISSHILNMLDDICDVILYIEEGYVVSSYTKDSFGTLKEKIRSKSGDLSFDI